MRSRGSTKRTHPHNALPTDLAAEAVGDPARADDVLGEAARISRAQCAQGLPAAPTNPPTTPSRTCLSRPAPRVSLAVCHYLLLSVRV